MVYKNELPSKKLFSKHKIKFNFKTLFVNLTSICREITTKQEQVMLRQNSLKLQKEKGVNNKQCKGFQFLRERYSSINHSTQKRILPLSTFHPLIDKTCILSHKSSKKSCNVKMKCYKYNHFQPPSKRVLKGSKNTETYQDKKYLSYKKNALSCQYIKSITN